MEQGLSRCEKKQFYCHKSLIPYVIYYYSYIRFLLFYVLLTDAESVDDYQSVI